MIISWGFVGSVILNYTLDILNVMLFLTINPLPFYNLLENLTGHQVS